MNKYIIAYVIGSGDLRIEEHWADNWWEAVEEVTLQRVWNKQSLKDSKKLAREDGWQFDIVRSHLK